MALSWDLITWLAGRGTPWFLVLARVSGLAWTAPGLATVGLDARFRLFLAVCLTVMITPLVGREIAIVPGLPSLAGACVFEAVIGAGLGWSASLVIASARQAGEIVGAQAGLSPAALFDPSLGEAMTPMGHLYGLVAMGVFLALSGPTELVRALAESYRVVPAGGALPTLETANWAFGMVGQSLALTLRLAAPPALALILAGLALGLLGRASPSLQLVSLSLPVRTMLGLFLALLGIASLALILGHAWQGVFPWG